MDKGNLIDSLSGAFLEAFRHALKTSDKTTVAGGSCVHLVAPMIAERVGEQGFTTEKATALASVAGKLRGEEILKLEDASGVDALTVEFETINEGIRQHWRIAELSILIGHTIAGANRR